MKISVTQKHIDEGKRGDCLRCALSLAVVDAFDAVAPVPEGSFAVTITSQQPLMSFSPASFRNTVHFLTVAEDDAVRLRNFITAFDQGHPVQPIEFLASVHPPYPSTP